VVSRTRQAALPANAGTLLLPRSILARGQLNPYLQGAQSRGSNNGKSGADNNVGLLNVDASPEEGMTFHCAGRPGFRWVVGFRGFAHSTSS
jgi:hypothetical protein